MTKQKPKFIKKPDAIIELNKSVDKAQITGLTVADLINASKDKGNKDKLVGDLADKMFNKEFLHMIARLDNNLAYYILKHIIINIYFIKTWANVKAINTIVPTKNGYYVDSKLTNGDLFKSLIESYKELIDSIEMITISLGGQGRQEIIAIIKAMMVRLNEEENIKKAGGLNRLFG
jgi:hypothetical protein